MQAGKTSADGRKRIRHEAKDRPPRSTLRSPRERLVACLLCRPGVAHESFRRLQGCGSQYGWNEYYRSNQVLLNM